VPALMMCALQILLLQTPDGSIKLDRPLPVAWTDYVMQYDDGTAYWMAFAGSVRGVWFNAEDFYGGGISELLVNHLEFWFYHHASYPWDTQFFYAELWNGDDASGPSALLDQTSVTAAHYAPCYANYPSPILTEADIWGLVNTEMSTGGWPSTLGDNTPNTVNHSYYMSDEYVWTPWIVQGPTANDFLIRADGAPPGWDLGQSTWGSIKGLYCR